VSDRVVFSPKADFQISEIYRSIAEASGDVRASDFVGAILDRCEALADFPEQGAPRFEYRPGLRIIGFRRRVTIAYGVEKGSIIILGIYYGGQNYQADFADEI
jgi:toxin ParE1/3/4